MRNEQPSPNDEGVWDIRELEEKVNKPNQWGSVGSKAFKALSVTHERIPSGCYSVTVDNRDGQSIFMGRDIKIDSIQTFKGDIIGSVMNEVNDFWGKEKVFKDNGFLHRRGYLFYGPGGSGKSSMVWQIAQDVIKRGGIVFVCDHPKFFVQGLHTFRKVEPNRPIVCVFEDIDAIIARYGESDILQLLDGDSQINRVINIATTNYPEHLDRRIVSRPRRFDRIYKIIAPSDEVRIQFLKNKLPKSQKVKEWISKTKGLSFASLTECLISVICLGNNLDETIAVLREIESDKPKSSDFADKKGDIGFGPKELED